MIAGKPCQLTNLVISIVAALTLDFFCNEMSVFANESFVKRYQVVGQGNDLPSLQSTKKREPGGETRVAGKADTQSPPIEDNARESVAKLEISVHGSMCPSCLLNLKKEIAALSGVKTVDVSAFALSDKQKAWHGSKTVAHYQVDFEPRLISKGQIEARIKQLDFGVSSAKIVH